MNESRRQFLTRTSACLGITAAWSLFANEPVPGVLRSTHFAPKAKNVIFLFMAGGPSHVDTFDPKPLLRERHGQEMPASILGTQRVTLMTRNQGHFKTAATPYRFRKVGQAGHDMSDLWTHLPSVADELTFIRSVHTEPINHDPAVTFMQTGRDQAGLPSIGSWCSYGLGSENRDLPAYIVLTSGPMDQPVPSRSFHSGFLPAQHQGVQFHGAADPVSYLSNPDGISGQARGEMIEGINELNRLHHARVRDPEIEASIHSFELAFRMQTSVPGLTNTADESAATLARYGREVNTPGSFGRHCLLARRMIERDVRFVQLFHRGWDQHSDVVANLRRQVDAVDQPIAALLLDLKTRGLLETTLVVWAGEFGRTAYGQGDLATNFGRDHHPRCFTVWLAGAGIKPGVVHGVTDDFGYNVAENPVHVNDLHATMLHCLGIDHERLTYPFGGRDFRLTDVAGRAVTEVLS